MMAWLGFAGLVVVWLMGVFWCLNATLEEDGAVRLMGLLGLVFLVVAPIAVLAVANRDHLQTCPGRMEVYECGVVPAHLQPAGKGFLPVPERVVRCARCVP